MDKLHFLRYGTSAEQKYMREYQHTYDCIALNGTMLAHTSKGIATFMHKDVDKDYFVDPMTHSFQHEIDKIQNASGKVKSSVKKLSQAYGAPVDKVPSKLIPVRDKDFNDKNIKSLANNVLGFQNAHIRNSLDTEYFDYIEYLGISKEPRFLVAPYFYMQQGTFDQWFNLNNKLIVESMKQKRLHGNKSIYAQLVIDKKVLLDKTKMNEITNAYSKADGLIYWIDGLDETEADEQELAEIKRFVETFKDNNDSKIIISLYGGFYSQLLMKFKLDGVVHGLEYGESRDVVPVGGGIPLSKFYLPAIKKRVTAATMQRLIRLLNITHKNFHAEICKCKVCKRTIRNNIEKDFYKYIKNKPDPVSIKYKSGRVREVYYPERESKELCLFHYLEVKNLEFETIDRSGKKKLFNELQNAYDKHNEYMPDETEHLLRWKKVLSE